MPVRTSDAVRPVLDHGAAPGVKFQVLANTEFLAEDTAIDDLESPSHVLLGGMQTPDGLATIQALVDVYARFVPPERTMTANLWSPELHKLVANAMLAQRVASINSISALCEATGANIAEISRACGTDPRIGPKFLQAPVGFGGSCFQKDILNLVYLCKSYGLYECAEYWNWIVKINDYQKERFTRNMVRTMFNTVTSNNIALFGFASKKETGGVHLSRPRRGAANVHVYDPQVPRSAMMEEFKYILNLTEETNPGFGKYITTSNDPYAAADGARAIAVVADWDEFKTLDYQKIYNKKSKPAFIFDGRNIADADALRNIGFPSVLHRQARHDRLGTRAGAAETSGTRFRTERQASAKGHGSAGGASCSSPHVCRRAQTFNTTCFAPTRRAPRPNARRRPSSRTDAAAKAPDSFQDS